MNTKEKVEELLLHVPELRDNDDRLCCHIWFREIEAMNIIPLKMNVTTFFKLYSKGKFTKAPSIKRVRAKLQEENPTLRGQKYYIRKGIMQDKWRTDLGYEVRK